MLSQKQHKMMSKLDTLGEELLVEILKKLPYKSLIRSTAVSKTWLDLIANPDRPNSCCSLRLKANQSHPLGFFLKISSSYEWRPIDPATPHCHPSFENSDLTFEVSSNGFILYHERLNDYTFYVANPFTNQRVQLPQLHLSRHLGPIGFTCRDDQSPANFMVAIIYDDLHEDQICQHVKIFSTFDNEAVAGWRDLCLQYTGDLRHCPNGSQPPVFEFKYFPAAVLREQVFYWINWTFNWVVSCDLKEGRYWAMDVPPSSDDYERTISLRVFEDQLYCGKQSLTYNADIRVWLFKGDLYHYDSAGRWVLLYVVDVRVLEKRFPDIIPPDEASDGDDEDDSGGDVIPPNEASVGDESGDDNSFDDDRIPPNEASDGDESGGDDDTFNDDCIPPNEASDGDESGDDDDDYPDPKAYFLVLHPSNPWIVFFQLLPPDNKLLSYEAESKRLVVHGKGFGNCVGCEWRPRSHSLPLLPEACSDLSA